MLIREIAIIHGDFGFHLTNWRVFIERLCQIALHVKCDVTDFDLRSMHPVFTLRYTEFCANDIIYCHLS